MFFCLKLAIESMHRETFINKRDYDGKDSMRRQR